MKVDLILSYKIIQHNKSTESTKKYISEIDSLINANKKRIKELNNIN